MGTTNLVGGLKKMESFQSNQLINTINKLANSPILPTFNWMKFWNLPIVPKTWMFLWQLVYGATPVASTLFKRNIIQFSLCNLCQVEEETIYTTSFV